MYGAASTTQIGEQAENYSFSHPLPALKTRDGAQAAAILGRVGGRLKSEVKMKGVRANGKLGGGPRSYPFVPDMRTNRTDLVRADRCACG
jgi:hypothetical protein